MDRAEAQQFGQALKLRPEGEGWRYYLADVGIHAGDILEMCADGGAWQTVRYEYTWDRKTRTLQAFLFLHENDCVPLTPSARFRWPQSSLYRY